MSLCEEHNRKIWQSKLQQIKPVTPTARRSVSSNLLYFKNILIIVSLVCVRLFVGEQDYVKSFRVIFHETLWDCKLPLREEADNFWS